jgi:hypothetical protein
MSFVATRHRSIERSSCCATDPYTDMLHRHAPFHSALALLTAAALVVTMSACDAVGSFTDQSDDAPDVELGRFEMVLSGAMQDTLSGTAVFSTTTEEHPETGEEITLFGLAFVPDSAETAAQSGDWFASQIVRASKRPEEGEYTFAELGENHFPQSPAEFPEESFMYSFQTKNAERTAIVTSDEGTLEITSSASATLSGRFTVETSGLYYESGMETQQTDASITVQGKFKALGGDLPEGTM